MAGYRLEYDHDWELEASSDGRKRRSFLPAPKKGSGASPTSPQSAGNATFLPQIQHHHPSHHPTSHHQQRQEQQHQQQSYQQGHTQYQGHDDGSGKKTSSTSTHKRSSSGSPHPDFGQGIRVGARIKIGGVKLGIVRYVGTIHLAPGIFCGVELIEADGTHDGEVNGHRYFTCPPKHGIFAPKNKVCLDSAHSSLKGISSDSDPCYSSNESLAERSNQALRHFSEGELEAVDCSKISPTVAENPRPIHSQTSTATTVAGFRRHHEKKVDLNATFDVEDTNELSLHSRRDFDDLPDPNTILNPKPQRSVLPRPKSSLPAPTSSKLPTFSRSFVKPSETITCPQEQLPSQNQEHFECNSKRAQSSPLVKPELVAGSEGSSVVGAGLHRVSASSRSSEESEDDGTPKDRLSFGVKSQLRGDSRQYLNFTFDKDIRDSLDQDESGSDTNSRDSNTYVKYHTTNNKANSVSSDSYVLNEASSHSILSSDILADNSLTDGQPLDEVYHSRKHKRQDRRRTSTPIENRSRQSQVAESRSYVLAQGHSYLHAVSGGDGPDNFDFPIEEIDFHHSGSTSQSGSDIDVLAEGDTIVAVDSGGWNHQYPGQMLIEGGYSCNVLDGDGNSATGLSFPPPIETCSSSYISGNPQEHAATKQQPSQQPLSSESYTVSKESPCEPKSRRHSVPATASKSYTIGPPKTEQSVDFNKVRHVSSGSSANGGDSTSSGTDPKTESSEEAKGEQVDDSSNGVSPEVSQTLEWDYGQDFDGKIPLHNNENVMSGSASTGTSESLSDVLRDVSEHSDVIEPELASGTTEDSDLFETPENDFENIDSLEDFPIFGKNPKAIMTDSGISDKDFEFNMAKSSTSTICGNSSDDCSREDDNSLTTAKAIGSDSSQETIAAELIADTPVSVEEKELPGENLLEVDDLDQMDSCGDAYSNSPGSVVSIEEVRTICENVDGKTVEEINNLQTLPDREIDTNTGFSLIPNIFGEEGIDSSNVGKKERPISLISTTSADTGYAPDNDSEIGTLTTNTPSEWVDRHGQSHPTSYAPVDDYYNLESPVDAEDFVKQESLALSRALLHQQTSTQSTSSNPSDTDDIRAFDNSHDSSAVFAGDDVRPDYSKVGEIKVVPQIQEALNMEELEITENTEDDRIEADQVHGPPGSSSSSHPSTRDSTPPKMTPDSGEEGQIAKQGGEEEDSQPAYKEPLKADNEITSDMESESPTKEATLTANELDNKKPKARKGLVLTKKKMDVIDHKLPNTKVASKLADYIKAPTPVKPKEEKDLEENKISKNIKNISKKKISVTNLGAKSNNRASSLERGDNDNDDDVNNENNKNRRKSEKIEKPKPIIKRTPPKSKWGNIMSQIEASKDTVKPKTKSEIKSSLAAYLNAPPATGSTDAVVNVVSGDGNPPNPPPPRKEFKSRHKPLPPPPPKIDLSKVKSKLSVPTAASVSKRTTVKRDQSPASRGLHSASASRDSSPATGPVTRSKTGRLDRGRASEGNVVLVRQRLHSTATDSVRSSHTDLTCDESVTDEGTSSKATSVTENGTMKDRRHSNISLKSSQSEKSKLRNGDIESTRRTRASVKSSRPSNSPARPRTIEIRLDSSPANSSRRSSASPTPVIVKAISRPRANGQATAGKLAPASSATTQNKPPVPTAKGRNSVIPSKSRCCTAGFTRVASLRSHKLAQLYRNALFSPFRT